MAGAAKGIRRCRQRPGRGAVRGRDRGRVRGEPGARGCARFSHLRSQQRMRAYKRAARVRSVNAERNESILQDRAAGLSQRRLAARYGGRGRRRPGPDRARQRLRQGRRPGVVSGRAPDRPARRPWAAPSGAAAPWWYFPPPHPRPPWRRRRRNPRRPLTLPPRSWPPRCRLTTRPPAPTWPPVAPGRRMAPTCPPRCAGCRPAPVPRCGAVVYELARPGCAPDAARAW